MPVISNLTENDSCLPTQQRQCQTEVMHIRSAVGKTHTHTHADNLPTWACGLLLVFSVFSSLLSGLQIRPRRNLIWWVSECRQPARFYGDGTCRTVDHFPPKRMHQQHSFISDINKNDWANPATLSINTQTPCSVVVSRYPASIGKQRTQNIPFRCDTTVNIFPLEFIDNIMCVSHFKPLLYSGARRNRPY